MSSYPRIAALLSMEYEGKGMPNYITRMKADRALLGLAEAARSIDPPWGDALFDLRNELARLDALEAALGDA